MPSLGRGRFSCVHVTRRKSFWWLECQSAGHPHAIASPIKHHIQFTVSVSPSPRFFNHRLSRDRTSIYFPCEEYHLQYLYVKLELGGPCFLPGDGFPCFAHESCAPACHCYRCLGLCSRWHAASGSIGRHSSAAEEEKSHRGLQKGSRTNSSQSCCGLEKCSAAGSRPYLCPIILKLSSS